jgi:tetratricopeptide (TPR) repeat protein
MKLSVSIITNDSKEDALIAHLSRTATKHEKEKNLDLAIQYLYEAKLLLANSASHHTTWQLLRLPKFLMEANRLSEALDECNYLLSRQENRIDHLYKHSNPFHKKSSWHRELSEIYTQMHKIYNQAGMPDQFIKYYELSISERKKAESQNRRYDKYDQLAKQGDVKACEKIGHYWRLLSINEPLQQKCRYCGKVRAYENSNSTNMALDDIGHLE